jgi:hypothetical protein
VKLRDIRFHDAVNVDSKMAERADEGTACAFGVVVGADSTLVPWTNVRWAKRAEDDREVGAEMAQVQADIVSTHGRIHEQLAGLAEPLVVVPKKRRKLTEST